MLLLVLDLTTKGEEIDREKERDRKANRKKLYIHED